MKAVRNIMLPLAITLAGFTIARTQDRLPSWNDTASKATFERESEVVLV